MKEWEFTEELENRRSLLDMQKTKAYCLQTMAGNEVALANEINISHPDILALPFTKITHKSKNGVKSTFMKVILPGYVFLFVPSDFELLSIRHGAVGFHFVKNLEDGDFELKKRDLKYAKWVYNCGGIIGMSKAIRVNGRVKILSGPLVNLTGQIKEYSKKNRSCRVELIFFNQVTSLWLPFEWIEEVKEEEGEGKEL